MRPSHLSPMRRFTDGGKSTQGNGACGTRYTRSSRTARTLFQTRSVRVDATKAGSIAMTISGSQARICSGDPGLAELLRHVARAETLDALHVDGASRGRFQALGAARVVDARPFRRGHEGDPPVGFGEEALSIAGELAAAIAHPQHLAHAREHGGNRREAAVEEQVGDSGLLLDALSEGTVGCSERTVVEDEVGVSGQH